MRSAADVLRAEDHERLLAMSPAARVALALELGARDLEIFRAAHPELGAEEAGRALDRQRQDGRRPSRCIEELIG